MGRVTVDLLDDDYTPGDGEGVVPPLTEMPTEEAVFYLMSFGTSETDARVLVAQAQGQCVSDARPIDDEADARSA